MENRFTTAVFNPFIILREEFARLGFSFITGTTINDKETTIFFTHGHTPVFIGRDENMSVPLASFAREVDEVLPGTARILMSGLDKLPLWKVLEKDESACKRTVSSLLADAKLYQSGKDVAEKCHTLLHYMVEYQFKETWCGAPVDLDKLLANSTDNVIAKSCKTKNLDSRTMLAIVALWILAQSGQDPRAINYTDYFLLGILRQPLTDTFGVAIADFIREMYRDAG